MQNKKIVMARLFAGAAGLMLAFAAPGSICSAWAEAVPAAESLRGASGDVYAAENLRGSSDDAAAAESLRGSSGDTAENLKSTSGDAYAAASGDTAEAAAADENAAAGLTESETAEEEPAKSDDSGAKAAKKGKKGKKEAEPVTLRVSNWEEYVDLGDWDEEERIELPSGEIIGENSMVADFEEWYYETYGIPVKVEYSTFGTNEDLYNMLTLGDVYDIVCPSEYLIMKLMAENELVPLSNGFFDTSNEYNYYTKGVSPFIRDMFNSKEIGGEAWGKYAAGYMWGVTGLVYNPEILTEEQVSSWKILSDPAFARQVTIKDNVRDAYFAAVGAIKSDLLTSEEFRNDPDYPRRLEDEMNDTSPEMIAQVQDWLKTVKDNVYSFETDAGKADMITGKVAVNYQWSGDAVYTLDQADEDDFTLCFSVPKESTDIYFDGWVMLKRGIGEDTRKQHAAEAFINFLSRPDNVVRNMYYIGYTSVIAGGDDPLIFEYAKYNYEAEDDVEETVDYDLSYFFSEKGENNGEYEITAPAEQMNRQLYSAYPPADVIGRSSIMIYFNDEQNAEINRMWVNVRCFDIRKAPMWGWILMAAVFGLLIWFFVKRWRDARS